MGINAKRTVAELTIVEAVSNQSCFVVYYNRLTLTHNSQCS